VEYYPVYLDIREKQCVVVGGGDVAWRKVERLVECGAQVTVVAKEVSAGLEMLTCSGRVTHVADRYKTDYIEGAFLVIGATDDDDVNHRVSEDSRSRNIPVNIVDDPSRCDFIVPAVVNRGALTIAISTGGKSPALAKKIREDLESRFGSEYDLLLAVMGAIRDEVIARGGSSDANRALFEAVLNSQILDSIGKKDWDRVTSIVKELTGVVLDMEMVCRKGQR
jgi:precorrin-2 dehydrogenase/sirohydrochlorin ferrochelatase